MGEGDLNERVAKLETEVSNIKGDVVDMKDQLCGMATKEDVMTLKEFFYSRDKEYTKNMWRVIFGLLGLMAAIVLASYGLKEIPAIFAR